MKIEEIKKDLREVADLETFSFEGEVKYNQGGNYILEKYYTPLAESHRELVKLLEKSSMNSKYTVEEVETALSNAKKIINEP